ncbi:YopX family protein [Neobacillus drentensis]|uniref:YopX family protein n=1 Tax=Neobacillus drentensis TaxID=220684 RepID=UPI002FFE79BB
MGWEIKFRAWDNVDNKMIYLGEDNDYVFEIASYGIRSVKVGENPFDYEVLEHLNYMQYTGITDDTGKDIFEGDIVKWVRRQYTDCGKTEIEEEQTFIGSVYWYETMWAIKSKGNGYLLMPYYLDNDDFVIVGNIYENPELSAGE